AQGNQFVPGRRKAHRALLVHPARVVDVPARQFEGELRADLVFHCRLRPRVHRFPAGLESRFLGRRRGGGCAGSPCGRASHYSTFISSKTMVTVSVAVPASPACRSLTWTSLHQALRRFHRFTGIPSVSIMMMDAFFRASPIWPLIDAFCHLV